MTHLDDELLSAHLDGEDLPAEGDTHLAGCYTCRARLDALRAAAAAVRTPVPRPSDRDRETAVAAALAAAPAETDAETEAAARPPAPVVPFRRRLATAGAPWLAVAAALVAVVLGVSLLSTVSGGGGGDDDAAMDAVGERVEDQGGAGGEALAAGTVDGGDLGEYADSAELRALLQARLERLESLTTTAAEARAQGGEDAADVADDDEGLGGDRGVAPELAALCEADLRADDPRLAELVYVATLRWRDTPAVLLAFTLKEPEAPTGAPDRQFTTSVYVADPDSNCSVLHQQGF